jgi:hypothetical protein
MEVAYKENRQGLKVLTPNGYKSFAGIRRLDNRAIFRLEFTDDRWLECTDNHKLFTDDNTRTPVRELRVGDTVLGINGELCVTSIIDTGRVEPVYDLVEVEDGHRYYTNSLLSSNCEFIINDETLINPVKLFDLQGQDPMFKTGEVRWFKRPEPGRIYVVGLDPSLGTGGDPAAIQVFEANTTEQVAEWKHNRSDIPTQIRVLADVIRTINDTVRDPRTIYYSVENNSIGEAALISIAEYGEENIQGYFLSEPGASGNRRFRKGFNTTPKSKLAACAKFKHLVESGRMHIRSASLVSECKTFVAHGTSYAAKPGEHDDLIMATLLAVRMLQILQNYHSELDTQMRDHRDHVIEPMPFIMVM